MVGLLADSGHGLVGEHGPAVQAGFFMGGMGYGMIRNVHVIVDAEDNAGETQFDIRNAHECFPGFTRNAT